ncbi:unnamed protein product [Spirodela intermedia]|uniref:Uncharacterized protein n=1 Tax=Spirodela intermedia TaxID=51605 RepID=A0A7I8I9S6_SPIIN|nr:unnamed protein product [Spirodela intermedia]CAA6653681.1 unnamed protein product [Spirodela intermedia]
MLRFGKLTRFLSSSSSSSVAAAASESCRSSWDPTASLRLDHPALIILEKCETREQFKQILAHMTRSHLIFQTFPLSRLLQFSAASHPENLDLAIVLFEHFAHHPNLYIYNTMLRALSFSATQSTAYYRSMLSCRIIPNQHTFLAMLKSSRSFSEGSRFMLILTERWALLESCFRHLNRKDIASCNILITALARNGRNWKLSRSHPWSTNFLILNQTSIRPGWTLALKIFEGLKEERCCFMEHNDREVCRLWGLDLALRLFDQMPPQRAGFLEFSPQRVCTEGCWNSAVSYSRKCFYMMSAQIRSRWSLYSVLLQSLVFCHQGRLLPWLVLKNNMKLDPFLGFSFGGQYCKCGSLQRAITTFRSIPKRDVAVWTAMMSGLPFMAAPNELTFIAILTACAHAGLVDTGCIIFDSIKKNHGIDPTVEHYGCLVDLLARAGRAHGDLDMARLASEELLKLEPEEEEAMCFCPMMNSRGVKKAAAAVGFSLMVWLTGSVASDYTHPMWEMIYCVLSSLNKEMRSDVAGLWRTSYGCMCS